jgi:2-polyprenyl-6-methoxyphenol hydroxylase and related FAD-dependent oxidoreductases
MSPSPVLVVGAGPTGLALACGLRGHGVPVRIVDAAAGPAVTSRALGLQPRGAEVMDRLGALGDLPSRSLAVHQVVVHVDGRELGRLEVGRPTRLVRRPGLLVSQAEIEGELRRRLGELGTAVEWGREVVEVAPGARGAGVRFDDGPPLDTGWVVGCDGAHSRVRNAAGIGFPGVPLVERFLLADVRADLPLGRDTVAVWLDGEDMVAAFPLPGQDRWRLMAPAPDPSADADPDAVLAQLTQLLVRRTDLPAAVVREAFWTSTFRFHRRLADTYRTGRLLLAGDAAHIHSPFGGQGLNTGIGDAENLAWKLALVACGRADERLIDTYEAERRPVAEGVLAATSGMTRVALGGSPAARMVRDHVLVPLMNRPVVQRLIGERSSQLLVSYRGGPLGGRGRSRPRPGDRVPDLGCRNVSGAPTRLHAELGSGWAVVATDPALRAVCADSAADRLGTVTALAPEHSARRDALLVRPDGHLAWRGTDPDAMCRMLAAALHRDPPARPLATAG